MKNLVLRIVRSVILTFSCFIALPGFAGQSPFTQNQFPVWYATAGAPVTVTGATESQLFQTSVPPNIVGNNGFMRFTLFEAGDALNTHTIVAYLGGTGTNTPPTGATALFTNTFTTVAAAAVQEWVIPYNSGLSNQVIAPTGQTSFGTRVPQTVTVGTQTNGLLLTITGAGTGTTNTTTLNAVIVEALGN